MNFQFASPDGDNETKNKKLFLMVLVVLIVVAAISLVIYFARKNVKNSPAPAAPVSVSPALSGKIYLSLTPKISSDANNVPTKKPPADLYQFDPAALRLEKMALDSVDAYNHTLRFSPDGKKAAFVSDRLDINKGYGNIFVADSDWKNIKNLTDSDIVDKQLPVWSPDNQTLAYTALADSVNPDDSAARIIDSKGNDRFMAQGAYPLFSPDGKQLLVLKEKGLYLVNIENGKTEGPVFDVCGGKKCRLNIKYNLSENKQFLAWTDSFRKKINILKINSWSPFQAVAVKQIDSIAFWPVFSFNNRYLAVQEAEVADNKISKINLVVYDLNTFQKQILIDLSQYNSNSIWVTDWRD